MPSVKTDHATLPLRLPSARAFIGGIVLLVLVFNPWVIEWLAAEGGKFAKAGTAKKVMLLEASLIALTVFLARRWGSRVIAVSKARFFTAVAMLLAVVFSLGAIEVFLRATGMFANASFVKLGASVYPTAGLAGPRHYTFDPISGYSLIPNMADEAQQIFTDAGGFRTVSRAYDPSRASIVFVGDSTVFGYGVSNQDTYTNLLSLDPALREWNIVNAGVPAYSLAHITQVLKQKVPALHPKLVLVSILWPWKPFDSYSNSNGWREVDFDFYRKTIPLRTEMVRERRIKVLTPRIWTALSTYFYRLRYRQGVQENLARPGVRDFDLSPEDEARLAQEHVELLRAAAQPLVQAGTKVVFFIHPYQYIVFRPEYRTLGESGRRQMERGLGAFYPADFLLKHFSTEPLYIDGSHLSPEGHRVFSAWFREVVLPQFLPPAGAH